MAETTEPQANNSTPETPAEPKRPEDYPPVKVGKKNYALVELSARKYQEVMDRLEKELGEDWQKKSGIKSGIILLTHSLATKDGQFITADEVWDMPIRKVNELSQQMAELNGMSEGTRKKMEKN